MVANKATKVKLGDTVKLNSMSADCQIWILRTKEEIQALHDADAAADRYHDDGGEPIIYSPYGGWPASIRSSAGILTVTVTARTGVEWVGWGKKPKFLRAGWCAELNREILFRAV